MPISHLSIPLPSGSRPSMPMSSTQPGVPPTVGMESSYPPRTVPAPTQEEQPWAPHRTTQQTWQHTGGPPLPAAARERRGSNALIVGALGLLAGVVLLALLVAAGLFLYSRRAADAVSAQTAPASAAAAAAPPVSAQAAAGAAASAAPTVVAAGAAAGVGSKKTPAVDAGAASPKASAAASAPPPAAKSKADEELEQQKQNAQLQCSRLQFLLRGNDPKNNDNAKQVKIQSCGHASGAQGHSCERAACRSACSSLKDQGCVSQVDNAERNFPAKF